MLLATANTSSFRQALPNARFVTLSCTHRVKLYTIWQLVSYGKCEGVKTLSKQINNISILISLKTDNEQFQISMEISLLQIQFGGGALIQRNVFLKWEVRMYTGFTCLHAKLLKSAFHHGTSWATWNVVYFRASCLPNCVMCNINLMWLLISYSDPPSFPPLCTLASNIQMLEGTLIKKTTKNYWALWYVFWKKWLECPTQMSDTDLGICRSG